MKKRNATDATLRNIRALKTRVLRLETLVGLLIASARVKTELPPTNPTSPEFRS